MWNSSRKIPNEKIQIRLRLASFLISLANDNVPLIFFFDTSRSIENSF